MVLVHDGERLKAQGARPYADFHTPLSDCLVPYALSLEPLSRNAHLMNRHSAFKHPPIIDLLPKHITDHDRLFTHGPHRNDGEGDFRYLFNPF